MLPADFLEKYEAELGFIVLQDFSMGATSNLAAYLGREVKVRFGQYKKFVTMDNETHEFDQGATNEQIAHALNIQKIDQITKPQVTEHHMSAIDRIKAKALAARNIAPDAIRKFEADLDGLIAEGPQIDAKRAAAVAPHQEAIAGVMGELDGLKSAIDILSND